jgi:hypothetical protein
VATSNARKIIERVQVRIQALSLTGIDDDKVVICEAAEVNDQATQEILGGLPGVLLMAVDAETINTGGFTGTNASDDIGYPVLVGIHASKTEDTKTDDDAQRVWRETIRKAFINQRLTDASGNSLAMICLAEPRQQVDAIQRRLSLTWSSVMVLRFIARELRG